jgi:dihydroorotase
MRELVAAGAVAFSDDGYPVMNDEIMVSALKVSIKYGLPVIDHCENIRLSESWDMNYGNMAQKLSLRGMPPGSEESMVERDIELNRNIGGKLHIAHVSTAGSVEIIRRAKADGVKVTAEVTPHHLTLTENMVRDYNTNAKVNPPLRTHKDIKAIIEGLNDNTIDIIATDHAPHSIKDKECEFAQAAFGISGFETALGILMGLVQRDKLSLNTLISKITYRPASIIGDKFGKIGTLAEGSVADITVFNPGKTWTVDTDMFISKGKNSPYSGKTLKGKIIATIYQGNIVYYDELIKVLVKG